MCVCVRVALRVCFLICLYCVVVQLKVRQLFYCGCDPHSEVTIKAGMRHKYTATQEKNRRTNISAHE